MSRIEVELNLTGQVDIEEGQEIDTTLEDLAVTVGRSLVDNKLFAEIDVESVVIEPVNRERDYDEDEE